MSGAALLARAADVGLSLRLEGDRVRWRAARPPPPALLAELRANRDAIAVTLAAEEVKRRRDALEERAAIMEFDGGMARRDAEAAARADLLSLGAPPTMIPHPSVTQCPFAKG